MAEEQIVLVSGGGQVVGLAPKLASHNANTPLHLGFSCYVFNGKGEILVTKRAKTKKVWPGVWTNSVCGHPAKDEAIVAAIKRRLNYELAMTASGFKAVLKHYRYKTPPFKGVIENEICPVYFARTGDTPKPNPAEVDAYKWMSWNDFVKEAIDNKKYSYWCKDQIKQLQNSLLIKQFIS